MAKKKDKPKYYNFFDDVAKYPDAVIYIVMSHRGPGKTFSFLDGCPKRNEKFIYMKRTIEDVLTVCSGDEVADINPYKPVNNLNGWKVKPKIINKRGIGYFADYNQLDANDNPHFLGYIAAMNAVKTIRGTDFSDASYQCLDEFVPTIGDITVKHLEGEQLLDTYMSFNRRREDAGLDPLKLVLFSNTEDIMCPITSTLEVVDMISDMIARGDAYCYDEDRHIMIHHLTSKEYPVSKATQKGMYSAMKGTAWAAKAFEGGFVNNDFSNVVEKNIQHSRCIMHIIYQKKDIYCYENQDNGALYFCYKPHQCRNTYDFSKDADKLRYLHFENAYVRSCIMNDKAKFQTYTMYDLCLNFMKKFHLR